MKSLAQNPPPRVDPHHLTTAAALARHLHPGPVGEILARELDTAVRLGYLGPDGLTHRLAQHLHDEAAARVAR